MSTELLNILENIFNLFVFERNLGQQKEFANLTFLTITIKVFKIRMYYRRYWRPFN